MEYKTAIVEKTDAEPWQAYGMNVLVAAKRVACSDQSKRVVMGKKVHMVPVLGRAFGFPDPPTLVTRTLKRGKIVVTQLYSDITREVLTERVPIEDAYLVRLMTRNNANYELWTHARSIHVTPLRIGDMDIYNLNLDPVCPMREGFGALHFYLPRVAFDLIADDADAAHVGALDCKASRLNVELIFRQLALALIPVSGVACECASVAVCVMRFFQATSSMPFAKRQRRLAHLTHKHPREMTLIREPRIECDFS
jgi:hypothetical protein